jgi:hypothetical protein
MVQCLINPLHVMSQLDWFGILALELPEPKGSSQYLSHSRAGISCYISVFRGKKGLHDTCIHGHLKAICRNTCIVGFCFQRHLSLSSFGVSSRFGSQSVTYMDNFTSLPILMLSSHLHQGLTSDVFSAVNFICLLYAPSIHLSRFNHPNNIQRSIYIMSLSPFPFTSSTLDLNTHYT